MTMEPTQEQITQHFTEMANGKLSEADIIGLGSKYVGGRQTSNGGIQFRMCTPSGPTASPIQNVTSEMAASLDRAKSKLGKAINLTDGGAGGSVITNFRGGNSSKRRSNGGGKKRSKRSKRDSDDDDNKKNRKNKKNKKSSSKTCKR